MEAYAVLETGGKQVLVKAGDKIEIEKLSTEPGNEVVLDTVCAISDGTTLKVGAPYVEGAKVTLTVDAVKRGKKVINFKAKRRKGDRRAVGHRQPLTVATVKRGDIFNSALYWTAGHGVVGEGAVELFPSRRAFNFVFPFRARKPDIC